MDRNKLKDFDPSQRDFCLAEGVLKHSMFYVGISEDDETIFFEGKETGTLVIDKNFTLADFDAEKSSPRDVVCNLHLLATRTLTPLMEHLGLSVGIISAYRSPMHNLRTNGRHGSDHIRGRAVDLIIPGLNSSEAFRYIHSILESKKILFDELLQTRSHVHISYNAFGNRRRAEPISFNEERMINRAMLINSLSEYYIP